LREECSCIKTSDNERIDETHNAYDKEFYDIIEKMNSGDELAFDELYKKCVGPVAYMCHKFCDSYEDAEEVVQDVFVIAFNNRSKLKSRTLIAYLRKIAICKSIDKRRSNINLKKYFVPTDGEQTEDYPELNTEFLPEERLKDKESRAEFMTLIINALSKMQWEMVYMYYFAEFNSNEIAELLDCTPQYVRKTLLTARKKIKRKIEDDEHRDRLIGKYIGSRGTMLLPLSALLFVEETAFISTYTYAIMSYTALGVATATATAATVTTGSTTATAAAGTATATAATAGAATAKVAIVTKVGMAIASVLVVGIVATTLYFGLQPTEEYPDGGGLYESTNDIYTSTDSTEDSQFDVDTTPDLMNDQESGSANLDRTQQILLALSLANDAESVNAIIHEYEFSPTRQIQCSTGELHRLYVTNEGSGDILVGVSTNGDGTGWRMRFEHYSGGVMPTDALVLANFMA